MVSPSAGDVRLDDQTVQFAHGAVSRRGSRLVVSLRQLMRASPLAEMEGVQRSKRCERMDRVDDAEPLDLDNRLLEDSVSVAQPAPGSQVHAEVEVGDPRLVASGAAPTKLDRALELGNPALPECGERCADSGERGHLEWH